MQMKSNVCKHIHPLLFRTSLSLSRACGDFCTVQFGNHLSSFEGAILALHIDDDWMIPDQFPGSYRHHVEAMVMTLGGKPFQPLLTNILSHLYPHVRVFRAILNQPKYYCHHLFICLLPLIILFLADLTLFIFQHFLWEIYLFVKPHTHTHTPKLTRMPPKCASTNSTTAIRMSILHWAYV